MKNRNYFSTAAGALFFGLALCSQALAKPRPADKMERAPAGLGILSELNICAPGDASCVKPKARRKSDTAWNICVATPGMKCCADGAQRVSCGVMASVAPGEALDFGVKLVNLGPGESRIPRFPSATDGEGKGGGERRVEKPHGEQMGVPLCDVIPDHPCCRNGQVFPHCTQDIPKDPKYPDDAPQILRVAVFLQVPVKN